MHLGKAITLRRTVSTALAVGVAATTLGVVSATSAGAGTCSTDYQCLYYRTDTNGGRWSSYGSTRRIQYAWDGGPVFTGSGDGVGETVRNNAASAYNTNNNRSISVCVYFDYGTPCETVALWARKNLTTTRNNEASLRINW